MNARGATDTAAFPTRPSCRRWASAACAAAVVLAAWPGVGNGSRLHAAETQAEGKGAAGGGGETGPGLASREQELSRQFHELERTFLRLADLLAPSDPRRAAVLRGVFEQARQAEVGDRLDTIVGLLEKGQLLKAGTDQSGVLEKLRELLAALEAGDSDRRLASEKEEVRQFLGRVTKLIARQRDVEGATEAGAKETQLGERQAALAADARGLAGDVDSFARRMDPKDEAGRENADEGAAGEKPEEKPDGKEGGKARGKENAKPAGRPDEKKPGGQDTSGEDGGQEDAGQGDASQGDAGQGGAGKKPAQKSGKQGSEEGGEASDGSRGKEEDSGSSKNSGGGQSGGRQADEGDPEPRDPSAQDEPQQDDPQADEQGDSEPARARRTRNRLAAAERRMRQAQERLAEANRREARKEQEKAVEELETARAELEEILRQMREQEVERTLVQLEARLRAMLRVQRGVLAGAEKLAAEQQADRERQLEAVRLSREQQGVGTDAVKALSLVRDDGSAVAMPEALEQVRDDSAQAAARLARGDVGGTTRGILQDLVTGLEEMLATLEKAQREQKARQQGNPGGRPAEPGEQPLVDRLAELKMIRSLQMRVNTRTKRFSQLLVEGEERAEQPELRDALERLAERQWKIERAAHDIVTGRTE